MRKGQHHSEITKRKLSEINKGKCLSEETRQKMSEGQKGSPPTSGMTGKHHLEETKRKISIAQKGKRKPHIGVPRSELAKKKISKANKGRPSPKKGSYLPEETKKKISDTLKGRFVGEKSPLWKGGGVKIICKVCGKEKYVGTWLIKRGGGIFCSLKCHAIWKIKHMQNHDTDIEQIMEKAFVDRHIPYLKQAPIEGIALADFLLSDKKIVQCDGDYWHSEEKNKGKDKRQDKILISKGYKVYRFWGSEIKKSVDECIDKIILDEGV